MGSTDNRAGIVEQAVMVTKQRAAFIVGMICTVAANCRGLLIREVIQSFPHCCGFDGKDRYGDTAGTAPSRAGYLLPQSRCNRGAEGVNPGRKLFIVIENV